MLKLTPLTAISSVDGRYAPKTAALRPYFSEAALIRYRAIVEVAYLKKLAAYQGINVPELTEENEKFLDDLAESPDAPELVKQIETKGIHGIFKATNHDVKAVEYYLRYKITDTDLESYIPFIHIGLTSEDTTNLAIGLMIMEALRDEIIPELSNVKAAMWHIIEEHAETSMLSRTHGQPASPTTMGKEVRVVYDRYSAQLKMLHAFKMKVKINGASGNYNAHVAAYPQINWQRFSCDFIHTLAAERNVKFETNLLTTQIEPHDTYAELFHIMMRSNKILYNFSKDVWQYISDKWLIQKAEPGEVGSSTMPHKVNPIDWENGEGNLGLANALFAFLADYLPDRRLQRDLSDSTVERAIGTAFAHTFIAIKSMLRGFGKITVNKIALSKVLIEAPSVLTEPIQTIMRREGMPDAYERLKDFSRGKADLSLDDIHEFIDTLPLNEIVKTEMKAMTPENYIGLAPQLAVN